MSEIKLDEYFLPELSDNSTYDRPFFSVDLSTDNELLEYVSVNRGLYSGYQGVLNHAYDWQISGSRLPYNILMMNIKDIGEYLSVPDNYRLIEDTALTVKAFLESAESIKALDNLQVVYQECDAEGNPVDNYTPITGLQAINAVRQTADILNSTGVESPANVLSCALGSDKDALGAVILPHYIDNSEKVHAPLDIDLEFLVEPASNNRRLGDEDEGLMSVAQSSELMAPDNLIVTIYSNLMQSYHEPICKISMSSSDWVRELIRKFKHPKYKLKKGCATAEKYMGVFALLVAPIIGKPYSSVQKYLTGDRFHQLAGAEQIEVIQDIKPLIEAISAEV